MRLRTAIAAAAVLGLTLAGCTTSDSTSSTISTPSSRERHASNEAEATMPPAPDPAARSAYIADLTAIDPDIVHGKPDIAILRGRDQCWSIKNGENHEQLLATTNYRFTSPDRPSGFGTNAAARILNVVKKRLCPDF